MFAWRRVRYRGVQGWGKGDTRHLAVVFWDDRRSAGTQGCGKLQWALILPFAAGLFCGRKLGQTLLRLYQGGSIQQFAVATFRTPVAFASFFGHILRFQSLYSFREVIRNPQVKRSGFELDLVPHEFCPFVPSGIDPAHEIEVIDVLECAEVCTLL